MDLSKNFSVGSIRSFQYFSTPLKYNSLRSVHCLFKTFIRSVQYLSTFYCSMDFSKISPVLSINFYKICPALFFSLLYHQTSNSIKPFKLSISEHSSWTPVKYFSINFRLSKDFYKIILVLIRFVLMCLELFYTLLQYFSV